MKHVLLSTREEQQLRRRKLLVKNYTLLLCAQASLARLPRDALLHEKEKLKERDTTTTVLKRGGCL